MYDEQGIKHISQNFGEPEILRKVRVTAWKESSHLPQHELRYGLGVSSNVAHNVQIGGYEVDVVRYEFSQKKNLEILSWHDAMKNVGILKLIEQYFIPKYFPDLKNYYFGESLSMFSSGIVIVANEGVNASLEMKSIFEKSGADIVFIVSKNNSSLRIFDTIRGKSEGSIRFGRTCFVVAEERATVDILHMEDMPHESSFFVHKFSAIFRHGKVSWLDVQLGGGFLKSDIENFLLGEGAESRIRNITLAGNEHFDSYHASHHKAPHTISRMNARGIAGCRGKIIYRGLIDIEKDCFGSRGAEVGRFLLASSNAEIDAIPSLDIRNSEVSSSHSLSINFLKENDFFYPALRGIEPYPAQAMLFEGFLSHEIDNEEVLSLIRKKLSSSLYEITD